MQRATANLVLLSAGAIWGMGFVAQSTAMDSIGPFYFVGARFLLAAAILLPLALWEGRRAAYPPTPQVWRSFLLIGAVLFAAMATQQVGLLTTTVTNSGFLTGLYVVFAPFVAILLFRQWPHRVVWPAMLLSIAGIYLLGGGTVSTLKSGDWLTILSAALWALQIVLVGRFVQANGRPFLLSLTQMAVAGVIALGFAVSLEDVGVAPLVGAWQEIVYTAVVASSIAFTLQIIGQRYTTAPQAAIFLSSEALFAALFGALFVGDRLPAIGLVGCALIFAAMLLVELVPMVGERARLRARAAG